MYTKAPETFFRKGQKPFQNNLRLGVYKANKIQINDTQWRGDGTYLTERIKHEALLRSNFIAIGGKPIRMHPIYMILGDSPTETHDLSNESKKRSGFLWRFFVQRPLVYSGGYMKKILVIEAGLKPGWTKKTADTIIEKLQESGVCECDRIVLRDEQVSLCKGCALCLERGENKCKYCDDSANKVLEKMLWADGIVTVTPNYSLQVPAILKNLYDRLAYVFHRPRLFGKVSLAVVVQGVYGGKKIVKYIDELMSFWGCRPVKGAVVIGSLYPTSTIPENIANKNSAAISSAAARMITAVQNYKEKQPSFFRLVIFRMTRTSMKYSDEALAADKEYYSEKGWFEMRYYTQVRLGPIRLMFGALIDNMIRNMIRRTKSKN